MIRNYIIVALRNLLRNKVYSAINILGLGIGIACCMLIVLFAKDELTFDKFHTKGAQIYRITSEWKSSDGEEGKTSNTGLIQGPTFKEQVPEITSYVRLQSAGFTVKKGTEVFNESALYVDEGFFDMFTFPLIEGSKNTALKDIKGIVISEPAAKKYFGRTNVVGETLEINTGKEFEPFTVTGVVPKSPQNSSIQINLLVPMKFNLQRKVSPSWLNLFLNTFIAVQPGADLKKVEEKINKVYAREGAADIAKAKEDFGFSDKITYKLQPFEKMHLDESYEATNGVVNSSKAIYSYILTGIALFILIIACVNFINLTVARSLKRAREIGIRKAIGSDRRQLINQFLGESFVTCFLAFIIAFALTQLTLPVFNQLTNKELEFSYLLDYKLVLAFTGLFFVTGLLAGFYPAIVLSSFKPVDTLYGKFKFSRKNYLANGLIILQFSLATVLIISTITIYSQFNYLVNYNLGYDDKNVMIVGNLRVRQEKYPALKQELKKNPMITEVSAYQGGFYYTIAKVNSEKEMEFNIKRISPEYFSVYKIPLATGRYFSEKFPSDSASSVIVNETFAKEAGWKEPLKGVVDFYYNNQKFNVIGVVKDYHFQDLKQKITPELFMIKPDFTFQEIYLKTNPSNQAALLQYVEKVFKDMFPTQPYSYTFKSDQNAENYENEGKWKQITLFSAVLTIFISCIGLFGLANLSTERRAREIGVRKVFGASIMTIVKTLAFDFLKLVFVASVIASPLAWWIMNSWLQDYPYRIELGIYVFVVTTLLVMLVSFVTVGYQALRAALSNPIKTLRTE